jgi:hypothetical protein
VRAERGAEREREREREREIQSYLTEFIIQERPGIGTLANPQPPKNTNSKKKSALT